MTRRSTRDAECRDSVMKKRVCALCVALRLLDRRGCGVSSCCLRSRHRRLADVGRHARSQHGVERERAADRLGREDEEEHQVGRRPRIAELRQPGRRRRHGVRRHEQRRAARSEAARRSRRADGVSRDRRRVHVAAHAREARGRTRERLAVSGRRLFSARRRQDALLREQSRRAVCRRHRRVPRQGERRPRHRREAHRHERRRRHLVVRHDGRGRHLSAQPRQLVAGRCGAI